MSFLPVLSTILPLVGTGIEAAATAAENRKSRAFSREMYQTQKTDALAFWDQQNKYNSPASQMQRLREAGLNPNLVYGGSGPSGQAGPIPTPDVQSAQFRVPDISSGFAQAANNLSEFQNLEIRQAQLDNLQSQGSVLKQEALLKAAQLGKTTAETARTQFDLDFASELRNTSADFLRTQVQKQKADLQFTLSQTEINKAQSAANLRESVERVMTSRLQREGMRIDQKKANEMIRQIRTDNAIRQLDLYYYKQGIPPGSPFYMKTVSALVERFMDEYGLQKYKSGPSTKEEVTDIINQFFSRKKY